MVTMMNRPSATPSDLSDGWHPAYLLHISEEPTPPDWAMFEQSPSLWRWHFAAWESPVLLELEPEIQSGITSTKFSPKGRYQASKAYTWGTQMLGRAIPVGEGIDWDALYPVPCRIKVLKEPGKDFVKVLDVEAWPEGPEHLPSLLDRLLSLRAAVMQQPAPIIPPLAAQAAATPPAAPEPPKPGMQTWGSVQGQPPASTPPATTPKW
jgi:hypothetical protein